MKFPNPVVGLIINYRDASLTARCIESLLSQDVDWILVLDNSEDNGASTKELDALLRHNPKVQIHISRANLGFAIGVNHGLRLIAETSPEAWVLLINNDAYLLPKAISLLAEELYKRPKCFIAYPSIDHGGSITGTMYYQRISGLITTAPLFGSFPYPSGCCLLIAQNRVSPPLFDEDFFMYGEDTALAFKLGENAFAHIPKKLVIHDGSSASKVGSIFYESRIVVAHLRLSGKLAKNKADQFSLLLFRGIHLFVRSVLRSVRFKSLTPISALLRGGKLAVIDDPQLKKARDIKIKSTPYPHN
ncbi:glycosyltransferase [Microbulbifer elongatus]|uniref:glycosyltransferase n=1 Tax=Microbulbifer elongatus TaxID=86173 RepID=UPI001CFE0207|nr:glycosyltransferase [Microbulbifer elongatus]